MSWNPLRVVAGFPRPLRLLLFGTLVNKLGTFIVPYLALVLLRDFQVHAYKQLVMHADFQRVNSSEKIHVKVPLHFINAETSPAVKLSGGIISHVLTELDVSCLPKDLPEFIDVDLANMEVGNSLHLSNITLPEGVTAIVHGDDPTLATAAIPAGKVEAAGEAAEGAAEGEEKK